MYANVRCNTVCDCNLGNMMVTNMIPAYTWLKTDDISSYAVKSFWFNKLSYFYVNVIFNMRLNICLISCFNVIN